MDTSTTGKGAGDNDDWETIPQKKDKKKKKKQRPVPLQEFFSSENGGRPGFDGEGVEYRAHIYREKETELTHDEEVMSASLHSYFADLLKQTGPVRVDDTKFTEAMGSLDPECHKLVARFPSVSAFMALGEDLAVVDKFVCTKADVTRALGMAVETVLNNALTNPTPAQRLRGGGGQHQHASAAAAVAAGSRSGASSPASRVAPVVAPPPPVSVWSSNSLPHAKTASESLFSAQTSGSSSLPIGRPADITVPPPPLIPKSFVPVVGAAKAGFGTIGNVPQVPVQLPQDATQMQDAIENLNKRVLGLTKSNGELLQQLNEREKQVQKLGSLLNQNNDLIRQNERLKVELREAQKELQKLKAASGSSERSSPEGGKGSPVDAAEGDGELSEGQLIIRLKNQLESEKLNSWTLKQQLEIERGYSARLSDRQALSISTNDVAARVGSAMAGTGGAGGVVGGVGGLGQVRANSGADSLGLRTLLGNIAMPSLPPSTLPPAISLAPVSASSASTFSSAGSHLGLGGLGSVGGGGVPAPPPGLGGVAPKLGLGQIMSELRSSLPNVREEDLHQHLANLKKEHGQLSSLALPKIVKLVTEAVKKSSPSL